MIYLSMDNNFISFHQGYLHALTSLGRRVPKKEMTNVLIAILPF